MLPALVGRDVNRLDAAEISRAVVESVAENTVDAIVAPVFWAAVAGAPGVLAYRAVNTLDSMVGHRSPRYARFGWASARADDVAAWVPARLTALLVAAVRPASAVRVWGAVRTQAPAHPSPNAGVAEASFAAALGLRLGGRNYYGQRIEVRPALGDGRPAEVRDVERARVLSRDVTVALGLLVVAPRLLAFAPRLVHALRPLVHEPKVARSALPTPTRGRSE
jgi:adenosylcobinamide-phosphate synthase